MASRTSDALEILQRRIGSDPSFSKIVAQEQEKSAVARAIYNLRMQVGLSQTELAKRVGTKQSVIARLEDGDYTSHTFQMLRRIADALNHDVEVTFVPRTLLAGSRPVAKKRLSTAAR